MVNSRQERQHCMVLQSLLERKDCQLTDEERRAITVLLEDDDAKIRWYRNELSRIKVELSDRASRLAHFEKAAKQIKFLAKMMEEPTNDRE